MHGVDGSCTSDSSMEDERTTKRKKSKRTTGTIRQRRESRLPPLARAMMDPLKQYEIIPNGNPRFLTKASQKKILEVFFCCASLTCNLPYLSLTSMAIRPSFH